jgi:hypothetical protein
MLEQLLKSGLSMMDNKSSGSLCASSSLKAELESQARLA